MVDVDKDRIHSDAKIKKSRFPQINLKSLIIGALIFLFFPIVAYRQNIDALTTLAAIGPLYIGYKSKTKLKGLILGAVSAIPLLYATSIGGLGQIVTQTAINNKDIILVNNTLIFMCVSILGIGAFVGLLGGYLYQSRAKAKARYEATNPTGTKNKPIKEDKKPKTKNKLEDTGSISQNIVNLFKPRK